MESSKGTDADECKAAPRVAKAARWRAHRKQAGTQNSWKPQWPPASADDMTSPLYSLAGMYDVLKQEQLDLYEDPFMTSTTGVQQRDTQSTLGQPSCRPEPTAGPVFLTEVSYICTDSNLPSRRVTQSDRPGSLMKSVRKPDPEHNEFSQDGTLHGFRRKASSKLQGSSGMQEFMRHSKSSIPQNSSVQLVQGDQGKAASHSEIRLVPGAPAIPYSHRAVHPFFLAGVLLHGLPCTASHVLTGERPRGQRARLATPNLVPRGWTTQELVNQCVRPSLGPTRISFLQGVACGAITLPWCPGGRFMKDLQPQHQQHSNHGQAYDNAISAKATSHGNAPEAAKQYNVNQDGLPSHQTKQAPTAPTKLVIPLHSKGEDNKGHGSQFRDTFAYASDDGQGSVVADLEVTLPGDLAGKPVSGVANYYVVHAWQQSFQELAASILQHYAMLPEVVAAGTDKFVPVYYWIDVFAVPQYERPCPEFKKPDTVLAPILSSPACRGVLMTARPWYWPVTLTRAWCLYEVALARRLEVPIQLLLTEETSGSNDSSGRGTPLPVQQLTQLEYDPGNAPLRILDLLACRSPSPVRSTNSVMFTSPTTILNEQRGKSLSLAGIHTMLQLPTLPDTLKRRQSFMPPSALQPKISARPIQDVKKQMSPFDTVIAAVDACLECVDLSSSSCRLPVDLQMILSQASQELGGVTGMNYACRQHLRPHILAALLTALLGSGREGVWEGAKKLVEAGGFLQWPSPSLVIEPGSRMGTPDQAAAFLRAALRSRAPVMATPPGNAYGCIPGAGRSRTGLDAYTVSAEKAQASETCQLTCGCNPLEDIVFLAPPRLENAEVPKVESCLLGNPSSCGIQAGTGTKASGQATGRECGCSPEASVNAFMVLPRDVSPPPKIMHYIQQPVEELSRQRSRRRATWLSGVDSDGEDDDENEGPSRASSPCRYADSGLVSVSSRRYSRARGSSLARDGIDAGLRRMHRRSSAAAIAKADKIFNPADCALSAAGVASLAEGLIGNTCLTRLVLSGHSFGCEGMMKLCRALAAQPTALACLQVRSCNIGPTGGAALGDVLARPIHCPCLIDIDIGDNPQLGPQGFAAIAQGISVNTVLRCLYLDNCAAQTEGAVSVLHALQQQAARLPPPPPPKTPRTPPLSSRSPRGRTPLVSPAAQQHASRASHQGSCASGRSTHRSSASHATSSARDMTTRSNTASDAAGSDMLVTDHIPAGTSCAGHDRVAIWRRPRKVPSGRGTWLIDFTGNDIGRGCGNALADLISHPSCSLAVLLLADNHLETEGALPLINALQHNSSLQVLQLRNNRLAIEVGDKLGAVLSGHQEYSGLDDVDVHGHNVQQGMATSPGRSQGGHHHSSASSPSGYTVSHVHARDESLSPRVSAESTARQNTTTSSSASPPRRTAQAPEQCLNLRVINQNQGTSNADTVPTHPTLPNIVHLDLGRNPITGIGVILFARGLQRCQGRLALQQLLVDDVGCDGPGALALARVLCHGGARAVDTRQGAASVVQRGRSRDASPQHIRPNPGHAAWHGHGGHGVELRASSPNARSTSAHRRAHQQHQKAACFAIAHLDLSCNPIGHEGAVALAAAVPKAPSLVSLCIRQCQVDVEGRLALLTAMQLNNSSSSKLRYIDLSDNCQNPATYIPVSIPGDRQAMHPNSRCHDHMKKPGNQHPHGQGVDHDLSHGGHQNGGGDALDEAQRLSYEGLLAQTLTISTQLQLTREHLQILL